jgi:biopolymer transport protein ExbD
MNFRKRSKSGSEVSTHSLNDIMFFLMLFFLIASTMANPNVIKLLLPSAKSTQVVNTKQINLSVTKDLQYYIDSKSISFDEIKPGLAAALSNNKDATVVVRMENTLAVQKLVDLLEIGNDLKVKMILAANKK